MRAFAFFVLALAVPLTGHATTFRVNLADDFPDKNPGDGVCDAGLDIGFRSCTLRAAIEQSNALGTTPSGPHRIDVPGGTFFLRLGRLEIKTSLIIKGIGPRNPTIIDAFRMSPVLLISNPGTKARISNVTIRNGDNINFFLEGAGISISEGTFLLLENSIVSDNTGTTSAPGIVNLGFLTLLGSTVRNNQICDNFIDGKCVDIGGGGVTSFGGGIRNTGTLKVIESTISNNLAVRGGGIFNFGLVDILNSTISGNKASVGAGIVNVKLSGIKNSGIMNISFSTVTLNETIITGDPLRFGGGIVIFDGGVVNIGNTILAANADINPRDPFTPPGDAFSPDCNNVVGPIITNSGRTTTTGTFGTFKSLGGNIAGLMNKNCAGFVKPFDQFGVPKSGKMGIGTPMDSLDPLLKPLAFNNDGPTQTHDLQEHSPARDRGTGGIPPPRPGPFFDCPAFDQNGISRPQFLACDVGAFEARFLQ